MGNIWGKDKPLKEIVRENQRVLRKSIRELEKEIENLKRQQKKLETEIKKSAKLNQMSAAKIMAKDLVRTRSHITKFIELKTHLNAVSLKMQTIKSHDAMQTAMKGVTKALVAMNNKMNLPGLQKIMAEFLQENERSEFVQEALGDALDDAMAEEGSTEQEEAIVNQVFDELGVSLIQSVPDAPIGTQQKEVEGTVFKVPALAAVTGGGAGGGSGAGAGAGSSTTAGAASAPSAGASAGSADPDLASLEARLNNLRNGNP